MISKALLLHSPRRLVWVEEELPQLTENDVVVRTSCGSVSIGTELAEYRGQSRWGKACPLVLGYENVGTVVEAGAKARGLLNKRVVCSIGHRDLGVVASSSCLVVPEDIRSEDAILLILVADVSVAVDKCGQDITESSFLITGGGALGLLTLFVLTARGAKSVDLVEPLEERRSIASALGANMVVTPTAANRLEINYDFGFECSDSDSAFSLLQEKVRSGGKISVVADGNKGTFKLTENFHRKALTIHGCNDAADLRQTSEWYFRELREGRGKALSVLIQQSVEFDDLPKFFAMLDQNLIKPTKVLVV